MQQIKNLVSYHMEDLTTVKNFVDVEGKKIADVKASYSA